MHIHPKLLGPDTKLTYNEHIDNMTGKASKTIHNQSSLLDQVDHKETLLSPYNVAIVLEYTFTIWSPIALTTNIAKTTNYKQHYTQCKWLHT